MRTIEEKKSSKKISQNLIESLVDMSRLKPGQFAKILKDLEKSLAEMKNPRALRPKKAAPARPIPAFRLGDRDLIVEAEERWEIERENQAMGRDR